MSTLLICMIGLVLAGFILLLIMRVKANQELIRIWQKLESVPAATIFTEDMVAELPAPVQRYFLHAIAPGTALATSVRLNMSGGFRMAQHKPWIPMQAQQIISRSKGFIWQAVIGHGIWQFSGADYYINNSGRTQFYLWGILPIVNAHNADIARSAIARFAGEYFWLPSALLPQQGVCWQSLDEHTIQASLTIDGEPVTLTLAIADDGKLLKMSLPRWGDKTADGSYAYIPFGGEFHQEQTVDGFTIPTQVSAGWWFGTENYLQFFRCTINQATFCD